jgi:hypothetical protein
VWRRVRANGCGSSSAETFPTHVAASAAGKSVARCFGIPFVEAR